MKRSGLFIRYYFSGAYDGSAGFGIPAHATGEYVKIKLDIAPKKVILQADIDAQDPMTNYTKAQLLAQMAKTTLVNARTGTP
jgi:hypothetical protein